MVSVHTAGGPQETQEKKHENHLFPHGGHFPALVRWPIHGQAVQRQQTHAGLRGHSHSYLLGLAND